MNYAICNIIIMTKWTNKEEDKIKKNIKIINGHIDVEI